MSKMQIVRLRVTYGEEEFTVDIPAPGLVPKEHVGNCFVQVTGITNPQTIDKNRGWSWETVEYGDGQEE